MNPELRTVADAFIELQHARHLAHYDNGKTWTRIDVMTLIRLAETAFQAWRVVADRPVAQDFLLAMIVDRK